MVAATPTAPTALPAPAGAPAAFIDWQKPQVSMLTALSLPTLVGVFNFGWRVAATVAVSMLVCAAVEYAFTRRDGKPASSAALVTGALIALIVPPNTPFWQIGVGGGFAMVFAKMAFGGFGKNVFNPAMVARCFLYISFPATLAATWHAPFTSLPGGFATWTTVETARPVDASLDRVDAVTSATVLSAGKRLNQLALEASAAQDRAQAAGDAAGAARWQAERERLTGVYEAIPVGRLFLGNHNGSCGETSSLAILLAMAFLLVRKVLFVPLIVGPLLGMIGTKLVLKAAGIDVMPLGPSLLITIFGGGTMFAVTFMTTEPITAPMNPTARWWYGILIGVFAAIIRSMSVFNAGLMFSILLGNMFGPIIEIGCDEWAARRKAAAAAATIPPPAATGGGAPGTGVATAAGNQGAAG